MFCFGLILCALEINQAPQKFFGQFWEKIALKIMPLIVHIPSFISKSLSQDSASGVLRSSSPLLSLLTEYKLNRIIMNLKNNYY